MENEEPERIVVGPRRHQESYKYAVVDLATAVSMRSMLLRQLRTVAVPLFAYDAPYEVLEVGPWVIKLSEAEGLARALESLGTELPWGYYVYATIDIFSVRQTLRRFNLVGLHGKSRPVLFRYWDPRVMRNFQKIMSPGQRRRFFDFIDRIQAVDGSFDCRATD